MHKDILKFLTKYATDEYAVNRLIVSAFLLEKRITKIKNQKIQRLLINKDELEYSFLIQFIEIIKKVNQSFSFEQLLEFFEFVISPSDKLINGAIYTPKDIRAYITKQSFKELNRINNLKIVDISCGCGGFLIDASKELKAKTNKSYKKIFQDNIYGVDIQKYSVERTEILLSLLAITEGEDEKEFNFNIYHGDSLKYDWKERKFDMILGNPPYVCSRNMDSETKKLMRNWSSCRSGHPDLYIPFFQIGFELLKDDGILGYITVNSFIHSVNGRAIREYFEDKRASLTIIDFGDEQIFNSRMTYTCLCFIQRDGKNSILYTQKKSNRLKELKSLNFIEERYKDLDSFKGWSLKDNNFIKKIETRGKPFGEIYDTKSGIATLKNQIYIFKPLKEDKIYYYLDEHTPIEKKICKDIINSNKLAKYDNFDDLVEKIIFPYRHNRDGKAIFIEKDEFKKSYPKAYKYLLTQKDILAKRDKGKGKYSDWYAFGRNQSLELKKEKLFFPQLVKKGFQTYYSEDENLYFYNGMCAYSSKEKLLNLKKIMASDEFWEYIENRAKNYASGYYGLGRNYLKGFGI